MKDTRREHWRGFTVETRAIPVQHYATTDSPPVTYMALVHILRAGESITDWHLPLYAQRWRSADEAHREALDYAIDVIDSGRLGPPQPLVGVAA